MADPHHLSDEPRATVQSRRPITDRLIRLTLRACCRSEHGVGVAMLWGDSRVIRA